MQWENINPQLFNCITGDSKEEIKYPTFRCWIWHLRGLPLWHSYCQMTMESERVVHEWKVPRESTTSDSKKKMETIVGCRPHGDVGSIVIPDVSTRHRTISRNFPLFYLGVASFESVKMKKSIFVHSELS